MKAPIFKLARLAFVGIAIPLIFCSCGVDHVPAGRPVVVQQPISTPTAISQEFLLPPKPVSVMSVGSAVRFRRPPGPPMTNLWLILTYPREFLSVVEFDCEESTNLVDWVRTDRFMVPEAAYPFGNHTWKYLIWTTNEYRNIRFGAHWTKEFLETIEFNQ